MDVKRLIAEIQKRPALWNAKHEEHKDRQCIPKLWQEVAECMSVDVDQCKRKWKNLRDAYRAEVRRSERRIERDKLMGVYDPQTNYNSKWVFFPSMGFIRDITRSRRSTCCGAVDHENTNSNSNGNNKYESDHDSEHERDDEYEYNDNNMDDENFHNAYDIKLEPSSHNVSMENNLHNMVVDNANKADEDEMANDMLFEEFQNIATPQAARRLSATLSLNNKPLQQNTLNTQQQVQQQNVQTTTNRPPNCKCSNRTEDQVHFLEDLGREEQQLIRSTRLDITRSNNLDHVGDSDYNFLVSFLPQMKKMSELQNLQFRAKMCDMVLNIFTPPTTTTVSGNMGNVSAQPQQQQQPMQQSSEELVARVQDSVIMNNLNGSNNNFN